MAFLNSITGIFTGKNLKNQQTVLQDDWQEVNQPQTTEDWDELGQAFNEGPSLAELTKDMIYPVNQDERSLVECVQRWTTLLSTVDELPQSQFVDEYIPLATDSEEVVWAKFLERFNLFVYLTPNTTNELSFDMSISETDVNTLKLILQKKDVKKFYIDCLADNLYSIEFDEIPILNGSSKENSNNPIEEDDEDYNYFSSPETKLSFIANSPLFNINNSLTPLAANHYSMVQALEGELKEVRYQYPKLVGRKIRTILPCNITTKEQLDLLSMTVPLYDINHFYIQFYSVTPVKFGTRVKFSLEAYNLQAPRTKPKAR
jgi:hypothetical protein